MSQFTQDLLQTLAQVFIALAGFAGLINAFQRPKTSPSDEKNKLEGLRLSLRLGVYGVLLSILPLVIYSVIDDSDDALIWDISAASFVIILLAELFVNGYKRTALKQKPSSKPLFWFGMISALLIQFSFWFIALFSDRTLLKSWYMISLFWLIVFTAFHFMYYTHREN